MPSQSYAGFGLDPFYNTGGHVRKKALNSFLSFLSADTQCQNNARQECTERTARTNAR